MKNTITHRTRRLLLLLLLVGYQQETAGQDCAYRPWTNAATPWVNYTFATALQLDHGYQYTLYNNWAFYRGLPTPDPPAFTPAWAANYRYLRLPVMLEGTSRDLIVQWYQRTHSPQATKAVIVIHGSALYPDAWFADSSLSMNAAWGPNYTNFGGTTFYNDGYDVFAVFVTHHWLFQAMTRRVASAYGEYATSVDQRRVVALFDRLKTLGYGRIHIVGISYGGWMTVLAARALTSDPVLGVALSVEGWVPSRVIIELGDGSQPHLSLPGWEISFEGGLPSSLADYVNLPTNVQIANGSCNPALYGPLADRLPVNQVINYVGAHEFLWSVWQIALTRVAQ